MSRHPLSKEENAIGYSKYWYWTQPPLNPLSQESLRQPMDAADVLPPEQLNDLFKPGYLARENGWYLDPDGTGYQANYIWMPNVTVEMIDWWYVWHFIKPQGVPEGCGNLRYKIWCPQEHVDTGFDDEASRALALDESIPMRARRYGAKNFITESIDGGEGDHILHMHAQCFDPVEFGFDPKQVALPENGTLVCAVTGDDLSVYQFRPYWTGVEMRVRCYKGYHLENGKFSKVPGYQITAEGLIGSCKHVLCEYPNLARFLPQLYAEEGRKPINAPC